MSMASRQDIEVIARHSNWARGDIHATLQREVYAGPTDWLRFSRYFLLGAGAAFLLSGIVFFFAYNWAALHRFVKIGIVLSLLVATGVFGLIAPVRETVRQVALTAVVALIGVLLAVLGQIYQTGANSYDYFVAWTLFAVPWVALVGFAPLWLLFAALLNATFITYSQQIGIDLTYVATSLLLLSLNVVCWTACWLSWRGRESFEWLLQLLALWVAVIATVNVSSGTFDAQPLQLGLTLGLAVLTYGGWVAIAFRQRSIYYLSVVGGSVLITLVFLLLRLSDALGIFFLAGILTLAGMTLLANRLNQLNKRWNEA